MFRELTSAELDYVSGGNTWWGGTTYAYYNGSGWATWSGSAGGGGGTWGYNTDYEPANIPPPQPDDTFRLSGEYTSCNQYTEGFNTAVTDLAHASSLVRNMLDVIHQAGWSFNLIHNGQNSEFNSTDTSRRVINWDPFQAINVLANDGTGTSKSITAEVALAHEISHAYLHVMGQAPSAVPDGSAYGNALEREIIVNYESRVINDLYSAFSAYGYTNDTRTNHLGAYFNVESPLSKTFTIQRPGCS